MKYNSFNILCKKCYLLYTTHHSFATHLSVSHSANPIEWSSSKLQHLQKRLRTSDSGHALQGWWKNNKKTAALRHYQITTSISGWTTSHPHKLTLERSNPDTSNTILLAGLVSLVFLATLSPLISSPGIYRLKPIQGILRMWLYPLIMHLTGSETEDSRVSENKY